VTILKGRIVSIVSAKGGSGATFVSSNLSVALAAAGKTVLLDLEENSSSLILNLEFDKTTENLLASNLSPAAFSGLLPVHSSGLYCAVLDSGEAENLRVLADMLLSGFQNVIFDAGMMLKNSDYLLQQSSAIFLVVNPDVVSLRAAEKTLEKLASFHLDFEKMYIVLNKTAMPEGINEASVEKILGRKVIISIPFDSSVTACTNKGQPLILSEPGAAAALALKKLSKAVMDFKLAEVKRVLDETANIDEAVKARVHACLLKELANMKLEPENFIDSRKNAELKAKVLSILETIFAGTVTEIRSKEKREYLIKEILQEALGLGPLEDLLADPEITEIMVNGKDRVYVEKKGRLTLSGKKFVSNLQLLGCIERIVAPIGRRIDESSPMVDARLLDGSRVNAVIPPLALKGPALTIRKFSKERLVTEDLIRYGSLTRKAADFLKACVLAKKNIVISGGTGSGKTTLLNIISSFIPGDERIITIEDSAELNLPQEHVITLEARPANIEGRGAVTIRDLVKNTLRMRPDRIVVGECRGGEALDMLQAMNTGHDGSLTTLHSNSPRDTLARLETLVLMSGMELPLKAIREQIASAVDIIVHQERFKDGTRKITQITEIAGMEGDIITTQNIFEFKQAVNNMNNSVYGSLSPSGMLPCFIEELLLADITFDRNMFIN